ncbi:hypothetical protein WJX73_009343 [Symbiochloris irregularis]|uniref:DUF1995 domain-containing protein n=1 Tax=Symbiochloris irregularis TaxID=706552 RepID=A0AAW1NME2_9CHLO
MQTAIQKNQHRIQLRVTIPETNPQMDVYRIGTLLELAREMATALAQDGDHVKVCVQQSMGQGVFQGLPLSLSGVRRIMEAMDWGDIADFVHFGQVGADQVDKCRYYVLIAPQNVVGTTIMTNLGDMVHAAEDQDKTLVLLNPVLKDIPSADAVMGIRGRKERVALTNSFQAAYHFRLLYMSSAMMYPIMGALRHCYDGPWEVYKRVQLGKKEEEYRLVATFDEEPVGAKLTKIFLK